MGDEDRVDNKVNSQITDEMVQAVADVIADGDGVWFLGSRMLAENVAKLALEAAFACRASTSESSEESS